MKYKLSFLAVVGSAATVSVIGSDCGTGGTGTSVDGAASLIGTSCGGITNGLDRNDVSNIAISSG